MQLPSLIQLLAAWLGFVGLIWTIFDRTEKILTADARHALTDWLKNVNPKAGSPAWLQIFTGVLNRFFGTEYLSWKTFRRSCVASIITLALMTLIYALKVKPPFTVLSATPSLILIWILANFFFDYVSLCESRGAISMMGNVGIGGVILLLIGDFILTILIFITGASLALSGVEGIGRGYEIASFVAAPIEAVTAKYVNARSDPNDPLRFDPNDPRTIQQVEFVMARSKEISHTIDYTVEGFPFWREGNTKMLFGIFFCSTFITSVWVWLYVLGGLAIKAVQYLGFGTGRLRGWLDIENQPMLAIGYVCMMLVTLCFVLVLMF